MPPPPPVIALDASACAALFERARATDFLIFSFGIGVGILFYAMVHDLAARYSRSRARDGQLSPPPYSSTLLKE